MVGSHELVELVAKFEGLLRDLDRLELPMVAVHVDFALRCLEKEAGLPSPSVTDYSETTTNPLL